MDLTCSQTEMLLSFYFDGDLKENLRQKVEEHLQICPICRAKYDTLVKLINDMRNGISELIDDTKEEKEINNNTDYKTHLSAYMDNELDDENNIKVKKLMISNKNARKYLEDSYALKHAMSNSFEKQKNEARQDFTKDVLKALDITEDYNIHPIIKGIAVCVTIVLFGTVFSAIILNVGW